MQQGWVSNPSPEEITMMTKMAFFALLALALATGCCGEDPSNTNPGDDDIAGDDDGANPTPTPTPKPGFEALITARASMALDEFVRDDISADCEATKTCEITVEAAGSYRIDGKLYGFEVASRTVTVSAAGTYSTELDDVGMAPSGYFVDQTGWGVCLSTSEDDTDGDGINDVILNGLSSKPSKITYDIVSGQLGNGDSFSAVLEMEGGVVKTVHYISTLGEDLTYTFSGPC